MVGFVFLFLPLLEKSVCLHESIDRYYYKGEAYQGRDHHSDNLKASKPSSAVPTDGLEHGPEAVDQVEPQDHEPCRIKDHHPPVLESGSEQQIRVFGFTAGEVLELHLSPEVGEVETEEAEDQQAEDHHILGSPGIGGGLAGYFVTLDTATGLIVPYGKIYAVTDVDYKSESKDGDHNVHNWEGHEVAAKLEPAFFCAENAGYGVTHGEAVDGGVKQEEHEEERSRDGLYEFLAYG